MNLNNEIAKRADKNVYRDGNKVIKVFSADKKKSDVLNEALNQARVEESGLNIPHIYNVTHLEDGRWAIVMDCIEGKTLAQLMDENPADIDKYLAQFVDLQVSVPEKKVPLLNKLKDKMMRKISETEFSATVRYELNIRLESMPKHTKLCHGDFNPSNVIITASGDAYIIDWAHATQGNASADVARTYLLFCLAGKQDVAEKYLKLFCDKTDTAKQYVLKWLPIVAASQSVKGKPEEKEMLSKWVDVAEYQ
ncbi:MAG: phosphotransferase [Clostridia bacterium]|nr:phosphotransferase [Clostridia bacterium]